MEQTFHYILMSVQALVQKKLLASLKETALTAGQPKILEYLQYHNGACQKEIARGCQIEAGSLTSLLNRMEENQLVERRILNGNRRSYYIFLTPKGEELANIVCMRFKELEKELFSQVNEEEHLQFMKTFSNIYEHLLPKEETESWKN